MASLITRGIHIPWPLFSACTELLHLHRPAGGLLSSFALHRIHKAAAVLAELASLVLVAAAAGGQSRGQQILIGWLSPAASSLPMSQGVAMAAVF